jgi:hypothetical protein
MFDICGRSFLGPEFNGTGRYCSPNINKAIEINETGMGWVFEKKQMMILISKSRCVRTKMKTPKPHACDADPTRTVPKKNLNKFPYPLL